MRALLILAGAVAGAQDFSLTGVTIVDGTGAPPFTGNVSVRDGRIASLEKISVASTPRYTLTAGFFDLHTHLPYSAVAGAINDWGKNLKAYLYCGVTSVVDFGTYPETFEPMRRLLREGVLTGPRIHLAARMSTPGGHGAEAGRGDFFTAEVTTPGEARASALRLLAYKPDVIKVFTDGWRYGAAPDMTSMDEGTLAAIVKEAHASQVEVLTHTVTLEKAKIASRAGVDVIAHGIGNAPADGEIISLMRKNGTTYAPTLAVYEARRPPPPPLLGLTAGPAAAPSPARKARWDHLMTNTALLRGAGVRIATGTDAGVTGTYHGWSTLREMELLTAGGLTPLEALTAAMGNAARALHADSERGTIAPGKLADLVLIEGAPHENIHDVERVRRVWLGGREVDRAQLARDIASPRMTPIPSRKPPPLIDDMEAERTSLNTLRVNATDSGHDHSKILFQRTLRTAANHALSIQAWMSDKSRPFAQVWFPLSPGGVEPVDASAFQGIEFEARGDGDYNVFFHRRGARDNRLPFAKFTTGALWKALRVPLPEARSDLQIVAFEIARPAGEHGWLELDNLRFY